MEGHPALTVESFRLVLEASSCPILVFEARAGGHPILYVNAAFERCTGCRTIGLERRNLERLAYRAHHDALTGIPNRYLLEERLARALCHAGPGAVTFAMAVVDLNGFKGVNDTYGHEAGDVLLRQVASRLVGLLEAGDTVARMGGDEFVLLLRSVDDREPLEGIRLRVSNAVERPAVVLGRRIPVSCNVGVSRYPQDGCNGAALIRRADQDMYRDKLRIREDRHVSRLAASY